MANWNPQANDLFLKALETPAPEERQAYLDQACRDNAELRAQVAELLATHGQVGSFLETPASGLAATAEARGTEGPGSRIGLYKLLQEIGEGGMGTVWMAEQTQPVQRKVALKIIKLGMDSRQVIARFEAERQALALMDHPNIARVLDAGAIADFRLQNADFKSEISNLQSEIGPGRPYFVMELVKGLPITKYCDEHRLTPRQRLELFLPVCQAIQHAHQKGIIHRDVKPSNVLVAPYDGKPVVKVIDFGVAKATGQRLTEKTLFTECGAVVGTLEYMSPEQAELNNQDIDTRSDIYSLGVLLYELLTGTTPLSRERLKDAAFTEMLRLIREEDPPKPSTRLSESKDSLPSISAQRHTEPAKLTRLVRGELDWIVMKALEKDRNRRYETANGFAMDVQRYLADEPVQACPPSAWYRFRKFARRHKGPVLAATLVLTALVLGIIGTTWAMLRATDAEAVAVAESKEKENALRQKENALGEKNEALGQVRLRERQAKIDLSNLLLDKGLGLCEQGEVPLGMLWLARSLENAPDDAADLQRVIRINLACWHRQMSPLKAMLPHRGPVHRVAFTPDGKTVLTVSSIGKPRHEVWRRDAATGWEHFKTVWTGEVRRWDAATG